jgi:hypothetical protein
VTERATSGQDNQRRPARPLPSAGKTSRPAGKTVRATGKTGGNGRDPTAVYDGDVMVAGTRAATDPARGNQTGNPPSRARHCTRRRPRAVRIGP